ncbi:hypothetical protein [Methanosarcina mazei]|nr:hypothetical protein [Methanosarcina mazei]
MSEMTKDKEKQIKYIKIKGWANGTKGTINSRHIIIALFLDVNVFVSTKR